MLLLYSCLELRMPGLGAGEVGAESDQMREQPPQAGCVLMCLRVHMHVRMCACMRACLRVCMRVCVRACVHVCVCVHVRMCVRVCQARSVTAGPTQKDNAGPISKPHLAK